MTAYENLAPSSAQLGDLVAVSVRAMLGGQSENGALVASPDFSQYGYCWLRDGSFVAHALDRAGEVGAAARFHEWAVSAIGGIEAMLERVAQAGPSDPATMPPARFSLAGARVEDEWPNFQIDGYGTWLWSLREHLARAGANGFVERNRPVIELTARYLDAVALTPCYDVWEEDVASVHTSTLACVYGGLVAAAALLDDARFATRAGEVRDVVLGAGARLGRFPKSTSNDEADASLLWLCEPFRLVDASDPVFVATVARIAETLELERGIRRYAADTYFGGGAWPVLTAWLGWSQLAAGDRRGAERQLAWVASHFDDDGRLGEQFGGERRNPGAHREWVERWGLPARELLWSHAMFLVLADELSPSFDHPETDRVVARDRKERRT